MKLFKIALIATGLLTMLSCSSTIENENTIVAPVPPTNLKGNNEENSKIKLTWTDNSTNETGFKIERKTGSEVYKEIGSTETNITEFVDTNTINGVNYSYRVYSYNKGGNSPTYSNELTIASYSLPILTTMSGGINSPFSLWSGGEVTDGAGLSVNSKGFVWSTSPNPTISLSTKMTFGPGVGGFEGVVKDLLSNTTYYFRAYATNNRGTGYGNEVILKTPPVFTIGNGLTDNCGNTYPTIIIKGKEWMQKNLDVCKYRNGDIIPQVQDLTKWNTLTTGAWCYYDFLTSNGVVHGKLYNGYAINDPRGIAPVGWHVSTSSEWDELSVYLGGNKIAIERLIEKGNTNWIANIPTASNEAGFTALPSGYIDSYQRLISVFASKGYTSAFWVTSVNRTYDFRINVDNKNNLSTYFSGGKGVLNDGYSIRCVKD